jgi:hypothetical protein
MKAILTVTFLCAWQICEAAAPDTAVSSRVLRQPLSQIRDAIQKFCDEIRPTTRERPGVAGIVQSDVPLKIYRVLLADCCPPPALVVGTEVVATSLSSESTRLEIRTGIRLEAVGDATVQRRREEHDSKILKRIIEISETGK